MTSDSREPRTVNSPQSVIGKRILAARLRRGWKQLELAARAGISRTTLFQLERGAIATPRASTLYRLAEVLEIPVSYLNPHQLLQDIPPVTEDSQDAAEPSPVEAAHQFDLQTNPYVAVVAEQFPHLFQGFSAEDWDELTSSFGTGGALTEEGVRLAAQKIAQKRETLRRLSILLETHLRETAQTLVDSLFELIQIPTPSK